MPINHTSHSDFRSILQKPINVNIRMQSCLQVIHSWNHTQVAKSCKVMVGGLDRHYFIPRLVELDVAHWAMLTSHSGCNAVCPSCTLNDMLFNDVCIIHVQRNQILIIMADVFKRIPTDALPKRKKKLSSKCKQKVLTRHRKISGTIWHKLTGKLGLNTHQYSNQMKDRCVQKTEEKLNKDRK